MTAGITACTQVYGVVGDPVSHSLSPTLHNRWIAAAGIDAVYTAFHLTGETAGADLAALRRAGVAGLNVTLPHKAAALEAALETSPEAARIGAANTLVRRDAGGWAAHNTDIAGFAEAVRVIRPAPLAGARVILVGAGGAARATALHLSEAGAALAIINRSVERARALAADLAPAAEVSGMSSLEGLARDADLVVNAASLGHAGGALALPEARGRQIYLDLSYGGTSAPSVAAAAAAGWVAADGLRMLVEQAAAAFALWFGVRPDAADGYAACRSMMERRA
ncbi:shikimate dehydrogenase [bacterium]|nr:shikimate dehydrogenase [bacterium]